MIGRNCERVIKIHTGILNNWFICLLFISSLKRTFSVWIFIYFKVFLYIKTNNLEGAWDDTLLLADKFKFEAISLVVDHNRTIPNVADSLGIGRSTLQKWLNQYRKEMSGQAPKVGNALTDKQRELQELRKQVKRLTMERDILNE